MKKQNQKGFTLIELIIYMALLSGSVYALLDLALVIQIRESEIVVETEAAREYDLIDVSLPSHLFNQ